MEGERGERVRVRYRALSRGRVKGGGYCMGLTHVHVVYCEVQGRLRERSVGELRDPSLICPTL